MSDPLAGTLRHRIASVNATHHELERFAERSHIVLAHTQGDYGAIAAPGDVDNSLSSCSVNVGSSGSIHQASGTGGGGQLVVVTGTGSSGVAGKD